MNREDKNKTEDDMTAEEFVQHIKRGLPDIPVTVGQLLTAKPQRKRLVLKKEKPSYVIKSNGKG